MSFFNFVKELFAIKPKTESKSHPLDGPTRVKEAPYKVETPAAVVVPVSVKTETAPAAVEKAVDPTPAVVKKTRKSPVRRAADKAKATGKKPADKKKPAEASMTKAPRGRKPKAK